MDENQANVPIACSTSSRKIIWWLLTKAMLVYLNLEECMEAIEHENKI